jgi:hypothetical protein
MAVFQFSLQWGKQGRVGWVADDSYVNKAIMGPSTQFVNTTVTAIRDYLSS